MIIIIIENFIAEVYRNFENAYSKKTNNHITVVG